MAHDHISSLHDNNKASLHKYEQLLLTFFVNLYLFLVHKQSRTLITNFKFSHWKPYSTQLGAQNFILNH